MPPRSLIWVLGALPLWLATFAIGASQVAEAAAAPPPAPERPNVLMIVVDDLNDWVGCLAGHPQAKTPNIDRLAKRGVLFTNAHCQAPICNPSRISLMTGRRPSSTGAYGNHVNLRQTQTLKDSVTLPQCFAAAGYETFGAGKLFHDSYPQQEDFQTYGPRPGQGGRAPKLSNPTGHRLWDWGAYPHGQENAPDPITAQWAAETLRKPPHDGKPFFLAVGFYRPHVPMYAPKKWFDLHPLDRIVLPPVNDDDRDDLPEYARHLTRTEATEAPSHEWFVKNDQWKHAVQSYLASTSFVDDCIGRVLDALDARGDADNTIIVLLSDHGWHLGEKQRWAKMSLWERSTRVPLIIVAPGKMATPDSRCDRPVGLIDLYPTLVELCGLKRPDALEGQSLAPLLKNPAARWDRPTITTYLRENHAVRSQRWRYIRYADGSQELYDHDNDSNEWHNLAGDQRHADVIRQHSRWLPDVNVEAAAEKDPDAK